MHRFQVACVVLCGLMYIVEAAPASWPSAWPAYARPIHMPAAPSYYWSNSRIQGQHIPTWYAMSAEGRPIAPVSHGISYALPPQSAQAFYPDRTRLFYNSLGDAVESSGYFPIEINVPDAIRGMWSYVLSRIPIVNRWQQKPPETPEGQTGTKIFTAFDDQILFDNNHLHLYP